MKTSKIHWLASLWLMAFLLAGQLLDARMIMPDRVVENGQVLLGDYGDSFQLRNEVLTLKNLRRHARGTDGVEDFLSNVRGEVQRPGAIANINTMLRATQQEEAAVGISPAQRQQRLQGAQAMAGTLTTAFDLATSFHPVFAVNEAISGESTSGSYHLAGWERALILAGPAARNTSRAGRALGGAASNGIFKAGVNITPRSVANDFQFIGRGNRTFVTQPNAVENVIGPLSSGNRMTISAQQARQLESTIGLRPNSLEARNILSIVDDVPSRAPASPISGNSLFQGGGAGLPGGSAELTIQGIPSAGGAGIRQIILEVAP